MKISGLNLIREAYSKVISINIEQGNFAEGKYLIDALEKLSENVVTVPVISNNTPTQDVEDTYGIDTQVIEDFIIFYVSDGGVHHSTEVCQAFEIKFRDKFTLFDHQFASGKDNMPNWKRRFWNVAAQLRAKGILEQHIKPYTYRYALTEEYKRSISIVA